MPTKAPEKMYVSKTATRVECQGAGGALGHPRVFYSFDGRKKVTCGYCDREFIRK